MRTFYLSINNFLKKIFFSKNLEPTLKYSIILFFVFNKIKKANRLINQIKVLPFIPEEHKTHIDFQLKLLFMNTKIKKYMEQNLEKVDSILAFSYSTFIQLSQNIKELNKNAHIFLKIFDTLKEKDINTLFNTDNILSLADNINLFKQESNFPHFLMFNQQQTKHLLDNVIFGNFKYEIKGLLIITKNKKHSDISFSKDGFIFNKYSNTWYSISSNQWQIEVPKKIISSSKETFYFYERKQNKLSNQIINFDCFNNIDFDQGAPIFFDNKFDYSISLDWLKYDCLINLSKSHKQFLKNFFNK